MESGLRGHLDDYFCDRGLFARIWLGPFLEGEADTCWVAEEEGRVVGYLVSSVRPGFKKRALPVLLPLAATLLGRTLAGKYRHHRPSGRFVRWFLLRSWREAPRGEASNFHFNVDPDFRGDERIGDALMDAYFDHLRSTGVDRFQIHVFASAGKRDLQFYVNLGFRIADLRRCTVFKEPTLVVALERQVPDRVDWQKCRDRERPKVSVIVTSRPVSTSLYADLQGQALPADELFVVGEVDDRAPARVRHVPGGIHKALAQATGDTVVVLGPAVRVPFDLVAQVAAAREMGHTHGFAAVRGRWGRSDSGNEAAFFAPRPVGADSELLTADMELFRSHQGHALPCRVEVSTPTGAEGMWDGNRSSA